MADITRTVDTRFTASDAGYSHALTNMANLATVAGLAMAGLNQSAETVSGGVQALVRLQSQAEDTRLAVAGTLRAYDLAGEPVAHLAARTNALSDATARHTALVAGQAAAWHDSQIQANRMLQTMQTLAAPLPGTAQDYITTLQAGLSGMAQGGMTELMGDGSDADHSMSAFAARFTATAMTVAQEQGAEAADDFARLLAGRAGAQVKTWHALQPFITANEHSARALTVEEFNRLGAVERRQALERSLIGYAPMLAEAANTWGAQWGSAEASMTAILHDGTEPLFMAMKDGLKAFNTLLSANQARIIDIVRFLSTGAYFAFQGLLHISRAVVVVWDVLLDVVRLIGSALRSAFDRAAQSPLFARVLAVTQGLARTAAVFTLAHIPHLSGPHAAAGAPASPALPVSQAAHAAAAHAANPVLVAQHRAAQATHVAVAQQTLATHAHTEATHAVIRAQHAAITEHAALRAAVTHDVAVLSQHAHAVSFITRAHHLQLEVQHRVIAAMHRNATIMAVQHGVQNFVHDQTIQRGGYRRSEAHRFAWIASIATIFAPVGVVGRLVVGGLFQFATHTTALVTTLGNLAGAFGYLVIAVGLVGRVMDGVEVAIGDVLAGLLPGLTSGLSRVMYGLMGFVYQVGPGLLELFDQLEPFFTAAGAALGELAEIIGTGLKAELLALGAALKYLLIGLNGFVGFLRSHEALFHIAEATVSFSPTSIGEAVGDALIGVVTGQTTSEVVAQRTQQTQAGLYDTITGVQNAGSAISRFVSRHQEMANEREAFHREYLTNSHLEMDASGRSRRVWNDGAEAAAADHVTAARMQREAAASNLQTQVAARRLYNTLWASHAVTSRDAAGHLHQVLSLADQQMFRNAVASRYGANALDAGHTGTAAGRTATNGVAAPIAAILTRDFPSLAAHAIAAAHDAREQRHAMLESARRSADSSIAAVRNLAETHHLHGAALEANHRQEQAALVSARTAISAARTQGEAGVSQADQNLSTLLTTLNASPSANSGAAMTTRLAVGIASHANAALDAFDRVWHPAQEDPTYTGPPGSMTAAAPRTRGGHVTNFINNRWDITQRFEEGFDPDRIITAMTATVETQSDRRLSSGFESALGVGG